MTDISQDNLEIFIDKIKNDLGRRKKYIASLNDTIKKSDNTIDKIIFMKITVPELYAQYEGFFKFIFSETINYIKDLGIENNKINNKYIIFPLLTSLTSEITNQKTKAERILTVFEDAFNNNKSFLHISDLEKYILNLDSTRHTMNILDIDSSKLPMKGLNLLYERRCQIAHGNIPESNPFYFSPDLDITDYIINKTYEYWEAHYKCVIYALDTMTELFINYISRKGYIST
ncbi:MAE_28990/MAE_18760 family HEPN-like nuclease [Clostridium cochlearium]|uniref:MAE_28990/MAE_18760 family HEPN-like nuclease n=1 Tax=Clostridium cochlearium TaxID=1494 RepID=UPI001C0EE58D|nr:MAE_28990/MAE_18760 family HEPN-like nuclease [Clostridium cochlearium]MBU5269440.1 hypothetical protein [Clostridium cochlearium]